MKSYNWIRSSLLCLTLICTPFVLGCKIISETQVYFSDIISCTNSEDHNSFQLETVLYIEVPTLDDFNENRDEIINLTNKFFGQVESISFVEQGIESFAVLRVVSYLFNDSTVNKSQNLVSLVSHLADDENTLEVYDQPLIYLYLRSDRTRFSSFQQEMTNLFMTQMKPNDFAFNIKLINDLDSTIYFTLCGSYVNKSPTFGNVDIELERRRSVEIHPSTMSTEFLFEHGEIMIAMIFQEHL